jgi:hypothetical protein
LGLIKNFSNEKLKSKEEQIKYDGTTNIEATTQ